MTSTFFHLWFLIFLFITQLSVAENIAVDLSSRGRMFEGIGAISGGGAVARMLPLYPEPQRSEILDLLFKPRFGASLQLFKVEVGGDDDTTQGVESSHRHYEWEEPGNFNRGYEFFMMTEAKKRNPNIKLYGLPWAFPGWLGNGSHFIPFSDVNKTAEYIVSWILGAKQFHGLNIDYIGVWNEKPEYVPYIKALYNLLKAHGIENSTQIVAGDNHWEIIDQIDQDTELAKMIARIAVHYPGGYAPDKAKKLTIPLCSSEDDSTDLRQTKSGCIARILNRNYATGLFTSTYIFNIISAFYDNLDYPRTGLLTANQPWSGWYHVDDPVWMTAHTTQFTQPGWFYLAHESGVGMLPNGVGSYVTMISPDSQYFTIVIETIDFQKSACVRPPIAPYPTAQNMSLVFALSKWKFSSPPKLYVRMSDLATGEMFASKPDIHVGQDMSFPIAIAANQVITLTNVSPGTKGTFEGNPGGNGPQPPKAFPFPYSDDFESTPVDQEGRYVQQQIGAFEVQNSTDSSHGKILQQMLIQPPVTWCPIPNVRPLAVFGNYNWTDLSFTSDLSLPTVNGTTSVYIGARIKHGGCTTFTTPGIFAWAHPDNNSVAISEKILALKPTCEGNYPFNSMQKGAWFSLSLSVKGTAASLYVNNQKVIMNCEMTGDAKDLKNGFVGFGTADFRLARYDNFKVNVPLTEEPVNVR